MEMHSGNNLKELRFNLGLRQEDIAKILHLNLTDRISRWENGKAMPSVPNLFRLCYLYKKAPEEVYEGLYTEIGREMEANAQISRTNRGL